MTPPLCRQQMQAGGRKWVYRRKKVVCPEGQRQVAAIDLRAPCSGIEIQGKQTMLFGTLQFSRMEGPVGSTAVR